MRLRCTKRSAPEPRSYSNAGVPRMVMERELKRLQNFLDGDWGDPKDQPLRYPRVTVTGGERHHCAEWPLRLKLVYASPLLAVVGVVGTGSIICNATLVRRTSQARSL
jgi:hypothetical protein